VIQFSVYKVASLSSLRSAPNSKIMKFEFISLFSGGGGLDIGFELAGWDCLYASDIDARSVETLQSNKGRSVNGQKLMSAAIVERKDVSLTSGAEILQKIKRNVGEVPLLVGGPPCQSWSSAGRQLGFSDPRGQLFKDYVRIAVETGVRWIVFENVRGLLTARGEDGVPGSALAYIRKALLEAGFQTEVELLNAADYGVPQRRVRLILIGYKGEDRPPFPLATHSRDASAGLRPWINMRSVLSKITLKDDEIIYPNDQLKAQLAILGPGTGVKSPGKAESTRPGGHWGYKQGAFVADMNLPARTVTASGQQDWIKEGPNSIRRLCPRECAALQSFPKNWVFQGKISDHYRQIGNAVPPLLAFHIANALKEHVTKVGVKAAKTVLHKKLSPLKPKLISAVEYTINDERRNGESRRAATPRRNTKIPVLATD
jgi:DNA (cytosine-5)-methyltransferase 1